MYPKDILKQVDITRSIQGVLALSHQCECVSTKITSITEECLSRNRRIEADQPSLALAVDGSFPFSVAYAQYQSGQSDYQVGGYVVICIKWSSLQVGGYVVSCTQCSSSSGWVCSDVPNAQVFKWVGIYVVICTQCSSLQFFSSKKKMICLNHCWSLFWKLFTVHQKGDCDVILIKN